MATLSPVWYVRMFVSPIWKLPDLFGTELPILYNSNGSNLKFFVLKYQPGLMWPQFKIYLWNFFWNFFQNFIFQNFLEKLQTIKCDRGEVYLWNPRMYYEKVICPLCPGNPQKEITTPHFRKHLEQVHTIEGMILKY